MNQEAIDILDTHLYGQYAPGTVGTKAYWESLFEQMDGVGSLSDVALTAYISFFRLGLKNVANAQSNIEACRSADDGFIFWFSVLIRDSFHQFFFFLSPQVRASRLPSVSALVLLR